MKALMFSITYVILFSVNVFNFNENKADRNPEYYCANLNDGIIEIVYNENVIKSEVTLENGTIIRVDGTVALKDGSTFNLKDGQCVDKYGNLIKSQIE